ncbi:PC-esterase domain-containing protein 1A [Clinocottus analis]|uniref:PC-esterase domain-containing protein 1A n=1 Tax=Clinocottus analis TaxID=304258 RepID=UPI0035C19D55
MMNCVSHQQASQLLHNKCVVVLGDSIQRGVYKDLVLLLQKEKYLTNSQLKCKGEQSFEQDSLVEGGSLNRMHNGTGYKEVRQFQSAHHLVRFYFVTRVYSPYMQSILEDLRTGLKPDVIIFNSCVWDISRYNSSGLNDYRENLHTFFAELKGILPQETLAIWNLTMPLGETITGGFLVPEIEHKVAHLRYDVIEANFFSGTLADAYGMDVLDLHFQFRFSLQHRTRDGVHWNALAHRKITSLLLEHSAQAWGVMPLTVQEPTQNAAVLPVIADYKPAERRPSSRNYSFREDFSNDSLPPTFFTNLQPIAYLLPTPVLRNEFHSHHLQNVMRRQHVRRHYAPYVHPNHSQYVQHVHYGHHVQYGQYYGR